MKVSHHPAKFCGQRYCGSGDIMVIVSHVILQDHVAEGWSSIMGRSPSWQNTSLPGLVAIAIVIVET